MKKLIAFIAFMPFAGFVGFSAPKTPLVLAPTPAPAVTPATPAAPAATPATPAAAATDGVKREIKDCTTYDGTKYKVVPNTTLKGDCEPTPKPTPKPKPKPKPKPVPVPCPECPTCPPVVEKEKVTYKTFRVYGLVGYGQHGLESKTASEGEDVTNYYGPIFGAGVDYNIDQNWSVGVQGVSNNSGMLSVGYSFGNN